MDIVYRTKKLGKQCNDNNMMVRAYGNRIAAKLSKRLVLIHAANTLSDLAKFPQLHCHELKGKLKGKIAITIFAQWRLVFAPAHDPTPKKPDGGLDWNQVTAIIITAVEDYHG